MPAEPVLYLAAEERGRAFAERWSGTTPRFACILAHTDLCLEPNLSAAGASPELRPLTPAADGEVVLYGAPRCLPTLPSNPLGPPGPAAITWAALRFADIPADLFGAGLRVWPDGPIRRFDCEPAARIDQRPAMDRAAVLALFQAGQQLGYELSADTPYVVLGESVPGGTTTALALLEALGVPASGRVSGSLQDNGHALKERIVGQALQRASLGRGDGLAYPLAATAELGDPMQPLAAGFVIGANAGGTDVLLAGGSQMIAVAALVQALAGPEALDRVAVGTTRWVAQDPAADVPGLCRDVQPILPLLAANLDFGASRHPGLRAYEGFLVKEGVGAGGAAIAALLATGRSVDELHAAIDLAYDGVLARP